MFDQDPNSVIPECLYRYRSIMIIMPVPSQHQCNHRVGRESRFFRQKAKDWIPAFAGMTAFVAISGAGLLHAQEKLTLTAAMQEAIKASPDIERFRLATAAVELNEPFLLSELDPQFETGYERRDDQAPRVIPAFEGSRTEVESIRADIKQNTLLGTQARLGYRSDRVRNPALFRSLDPSAESSLTFEIRQPLLRYFWGRPDIARRRRFRSEVESARREMNFQESKEALQMALAYNALYFSGRRVEIAEAGVLAAKKLLNSHKEKKRYGLVEESDLIQAEASLGIQKLEWELAASDRKKAEARFLAALHRSTAVVEIPALEKPEWPATEWPALSQLIEEGLLQRPDVKSAQARVDSAKWALRTVRLDTLPDLALTGSYGVAGLDQTHSGAWDDLNGWDHPVKSIGLNLAIPFTFSKERLERRSAQISLASLEAALSERNEDGAQEIKEAYENMIYQRSHLPARVQLLKWQEEKLSAEEKNFARGRSTTDTLVRFQQDIHRAELDLLRAEVDYVQSQAALAHAVGTLIESLTREARP